MTGSIATGAPLRIGEDEAGRYAGAIDDFQTFDRALDAARSAPWGERGAAGRGTTRSE